MGGAGSNFTCTHWQVSYAGSFSSPVGRAAINAGDRQNLVIWLKGADWKYDSLTLGVTTVNSLVGSGQIIDADMEMNDNTSWKVSGPGTPVDVESLVMHEAGHFLGLDHTPSSTAVMFARYTFGEIKTTLQPADITDVCNVYPASAAAGTQGSLCTQDTQCTGGLKCRGSPGSTTRICTNECSTATAACPTGYTCQDASPAGTTGMACLVPVGAPDQCDFCTSGTECATGICVSDGRHHWCSLGCSNDDQCGPGYACVGEGSGAKVCAPSNGLCTSQCQTANDCAVGYACVGGTCEASGNEGDRCEIAEFCKECLACVGTRSAANCRSCCGSLTAGGLCTKQDGSACPTRNCSPGQTCFDLGNGHDQLCIPVGRDLCQSCDASTPCQSSLTCVGGFCHAACNPESAGACSACLATGSGTTGLCACPGEIAFAGQSCATSSTSLKACVRGTVCVGSPPVCRRPCIVGDATSCAAGEVCETVGGSAVCVPDPTPGRRCATCSPSGACEGGLQCRNGRCYEPCAVDAPSCTACVDTGNGGGVCACDDQRANLGAACGAVGASVFACNPGLLCVSGTCRQGCDPQASTTDCLADQQCTSSSSGYVCATAGEVLEPGPRSPAGGKPGDDFDAGCGCDAPGTSALAWGWLGFALLRPRLRRQR